MRASQFGWWVAVTLIGFFTGCGQGPGLIANSPAIASSGANGNSENLGNGGQGSPSSGTTGGNGGASQTTTYVFTGNINDQSLSSFALDSNGNISLLGSSIPSQGYDLRVSAIGKYLATLASPDKTNGTLSLYAVDKGGFPILKASTAVPRAFGGYVTGDSRFAYVAMVDGVYAFDTQNGPLQPLAGNPYTLPGGCPDSGVADGACGRLVLGMTIAGDKLFYSEWNTHDDGSIKVFSRFWDGSLSGDFLLGRGTSVAATLDGRFLYIVDDFHFDQLECFPVTAAAAAAPWASSCPITGGSKSNYHGNYGDILVSTDNHFLFATNRDFPQNSAIYVFRIDPTSGTLTEVSGSPFFTSVAGAGAMTMDPSGKFLLVAHGDMSITNYSNDVVVMALDPSTGSLRKVSSAKAGDGPLSIAALNASPR